MIPKLFMWEIFVQNKNIKALQDWIFLFKFFLKFTSKKVQLMTWRANECDYYHGLLLNDASCESFWQLVKSSLIYQPFSLSPSLVDELFKEGNIKSNGIVKYKEFTRMVTLPPVDYWEEEKEKIFSFSGHVCNLAGYFLLRGINYD